MPQARSHGIYARIHAVVRRIPRGRVATYGQVAALAGLGRHARQVGYALHSLGPESDVPWQRVVNARGEVSPRSLPGWEAVQRALLEREGVVFDARGCIDLARHGWRPRAHAPQAKRAASRRRAKSNGNERAASRRRAQSQRGRRVSA
jgi:methylated-DNA-protein-cysteine methyltransferase-like protein